MRFPNDFWCGLLFAAIGITIAVLARNYRLGSAARMGPGYFPMLLGALLAFIGLTLSVPALLRGGAPLPRFGLRPLAMILLSVAVFGITLEYAGFALAIAALVLVGGLADPELSLLETAGVALFLVVFSIGIFVGLLGLPLTVWPSL